MITTTTSGKQKIQVYNAKLGQAGSNPLTVTELQNSIIEGLQWTRVAAGQYTLSDGVTNAFSGKLYIGGQAVGVGNTRVLIPIGKLLGGTTTIEGYYTLIKSTEAVLVLQIYDEALAPAELSSIIGTNEITIPEIRLYND